MNTDLLLSHLRNIPDFPKPGIQFKDVSTLFIEPSCLNEILDELVRLYKDKGITKQSYLKEYGEDVIEIHTDAISPEDVVLIHDDLLATGGSMKAAIDLVDSFGAKNIYVNFLIELRMEGLKGKEFLGNKAEITALLTLNE